MIVLLAASACAADSSHPRATGAGTIEGQGGSGAPNDFHSGPGEPGMTTGSNGMGQVQQPSLDPNAPPFVRDDTAGAGLDQSTLDALKGASGSCSVTLVYPYDKTVFPGGLPSPTIMIKEGIDAAYVSAKYDGNALVDYKFAAGRSNPGVLKIPQDAWNEITRRTRDSRLLLTINTKSGDSVSSCQTTWQIAPGNMTGAVYYNTYDAPSPNAMMMYGGGAAAAGGGMGAVMRLTLGQTMSSIYLQYQGMTMPSTGPCTSCHSISANGTTLVASTHNYGLFGQSFKVFSYPLTQQAEPMAISPTDNAVFGGLTPDGNYILSMGNPDCTAGADTFPRSPNNFPLVEGPDVARLQDVKTGMTVATNGLNKDWYMWMPQFSPDGKHVVFNHAKPDGKGGTDRRELAMMDYDAATKTFSNLKVLVSHLGPEPSLPYQPMSAGAGPLPAGRNGCTSANSLLNNTGQLNPGSCTGPCYPAFPFFTPDSQGVIFSMTSEPDFANSFPGRDKAALADLWYVDVATQKSVRLDAAVDAHDPKFALMDFYPTVMPIGIGGYFWLFWTSRRDFGTMGEFDGSMYYTPPANSTTDAKKKRIWVSAITPKASGGDAMATALADPSHPGFYLEGQSISGNIRAFATLNPCRPMGESCDSGLDCCDGYCSGTPGVCTVDKPMCSKTNEKCSTNADCCPPDGPDVPVNTCLGGFCGFISQTPL